MKITNKKAYFDYELSDRIEAGVQLLGPEVKAIRGGHADLSGSFVRIIGSEAYLVNAKVFPYQFSRIEGYEESRTRKLLLHKSEIIALKSKTQGKGMVVVPLSLYSDSHGFIKVELALGKSKKKYDKREAIKRRDLQREEQGEISWE